MSEVEKADGVIARMARAWTAGDGAGWAADFAEDADFVDAVGRIQRGRRVIADEHQKLFDTIYRGSTLTIRRIGSRDLPGGTLLVHTESTLQVPGGPREGEWHAVQTKIFQDGRILAFHNTARTDLADLAQDDEELGRRSPQEWRRTAD
ncbi:SgcJ/EcaC family oxidoreductase [Streptomyces boncukensis]|uniref:SgcJ/EcaC family oxidoreductase n=1 Tax=Streptomyces boncukensis TaxID=2711219 RepID=UPI0019D31794